ncbi:Na+/H+ antiporter subunit E [archaeon]|nr:Na+/H+ antiporter subunit E [archaeon]
MKSFVLITLACFIFYLLLTAGSGEIGVWSASEIVAGVALAIVIALLSKKLEWGSSKAFNPIRWITFVFYLFGPFFYQMIKANLDVAYRVITGKINPGIVKVKSGLKTDLGVTVLANSITLTPGTLTVDLSKKNDLFVHCLNVKDEKPKPGQVYGNMAYWVKKVFE